MKRPIVLVVRDASLSAVCLTRRGKVAWQSHTEITGGEPRSKQISTILHPAGRKGRRRPVVALVGPAQSQLRAIAGLPDAVDGAALATIVAQTPRRFFPVTGATSVTGALQRESSARVWGAAFDRRVVDDVMAGARAASRRVAAIAPLVAFASARASRGEIVYIDGDTQVTVLVARGRLASVHRRRSALGAKDARTMNAQRTLDLAACGVATMSPPLAWRPPPAGALGGHVRRVGTIAAFLVICAVGASIATTAGVLQAGTVARSDLAALGAAPRRIAAATAELDRTTASIDEIERFATRRRSMTTLLRDLTQALPDSTAITTLRVDSVGVSMTAVSPHAADLVPALTSVSGALVPQLSSSATRELIGGARLERATFRFHFPRSAAARPQMQRPR